MKVRQSFALLAALATMPVLAEEFRDAVLVEAGAYTDNGGAVLVGNVAVPADRYMNRLVVEIDGIVVTAVYETWLSNGKNAAGTLIVGDIVQARFSGKRSQWLEVRVPGGSVVKASVSRRERIGIVE